MVFWTYLHRAVLRNILADMKAACFCFIHGHLHRGVARVLDKIKIKLNTQPHMTSPGMRDGHLSWKPSQSPPHTHFYSSHWNWCGAECCEHLSSSQQPDTGEIVSKDNTIICICHHHNCLTQWHCKKQNSLIQIAVSWYCVVIRKYKIIIISCFHLSPFVIISVPWHSGLLENIIQLWSFVIISATWHSELLENIILIC